MLLFFIMSIINKIFRIINKTNNGIDNRLYFMAFINFKFSIDLNALVNPQLGHGILIINLKRQGIVIFFIKIK